MNGYLTSEQLSQMLRGINPKRVGTDGKGFSHVEAYEIRAHLNRLLGFGRWSADVLQQDMVFEQAEQKQGKNGAYTAWTVCYRSLLRLTVCAPDGTVLATYTEGATGEAKNQPQRGDAHDLALKTSESQALKRCAFNLGDQFGLSLFNGGSTAALVRRTLVMPDTEPAENPVDAHITQQLPREDEPAEPQEDPRTISTPLTPAAPPVAAGPAAGDDPAPSPAADPQQQQQKRAEELREQATGPLPDTYRGQPGKWIAHLMHEAVKAGCLQTPVQSLWSPELVSLKALLEQALKQATAPETPRERAS